MHYANGRAAKVGDLVRGKGYNLKHEFTGVLVFAKPGDTACNAQVATVTAAAYYGSEGPQRHFGSSFTIAATPNKEGSSFEAAPFTSQVNASAIIEYGQLDAFVALDPNTGEVLPPE